jgi:hypothetical protein
MLGEPATGPMSRSVLGAGFRIGGAVGAPGEAPLSGTTPDAFAANAHRFSVIIPAVLSSEQLDVVQHVLDVHRPAHTIVEICTVGSGMRVGHGLHLGLSSLIGRTGGWTELQVGSATLGRGSLVGAAGPGARVGIASLGGDSRVG